MIDYLKDNKLVAFISGGVALVMVIGLGLVLTAPAGAPSAPGATPSVSGPPSIDVPTTTEPKDTGTEGSDGTGGDTEASTLEGAALELRAIVDASIARMGTNGYVQENLKTGARVIFDPTYKGEYQFVGQVSEKAKAAVHGSGFETYPFALMEQLELTYEDITVTKTGDLFVVKQKDTAADGTAFTEYQVKDGVIIGATIRDRVGAKNELKDVNVCYYGLDKAAKEAVVWANEHQSTGGHD